jgi:endoglucanase
VSGNINTKKDIANISRHEGFSRGINLGNALEAPKEGEWGVILKEKFFQLIKNAGFDFIRVPIRWSTHANSKDPYKIDLSFFDRIDWVIEQSLSRNLSVIINIHHYEELMTDPQAHKFRFLSFWQQISVHYQNYSENIYFELLNEPTYELNSSLWNQYLQEAIEIIRETNPNRFIIVGPTSWNNISDLEYLILPSNDKKIIVTFHYYSPFHFTHQGAEWVESSNQWLGTNWTGTEFETEAIKSDLDAAAQWADEQNRTLLLGEFGAYSKADFESRVRWTDFIAREAEKRNISWSYWEFCSGFGIYNKGKNQWRTELLEALIPESPLLSPTSSSATDRTTSNLGHFFSLLSTFFMAVFYRKRLNSV